MTGSGLPGVVDRNFTRLLLAVAAAGLIPCLLYGQRQIIDYDGWWHLFIASQDRWINLFREWKYDSHPPLYLILLRFAAHLGHAHLILRTIGILSGCASTYAIGTIAAKIYQHKASALLAAAAYTFAWNIIEIQCAVRAYAMALLFILLAFNAYLDIAADPAGSRSGRAILRFGGYSVGAILSEYYVMFFLAACLGLLILRVVTRPAFRTEFLQSIRVNWDQWVCSVASIVMVFGILYQVHLTAQAEWRHSLEPYLWDDASPLGLDGFLLSNFKAEIGYFTPFNIDTGVMLALAGLLLLPSLIYFGFARKDRRRGSGSADPLVILVLLVAQLVVFSLAGRYPFGGHWRQQSILAPFVFLTAFLALDQLADAIKANLAQNAFFTGVGLSIAASFVFGWVVYPWQSVEPKTAEYAQFRTAFPSPAAIYADAASGVFYYAQTHQSKWTSQDRFISQGQLITVYQVDDGRGHPIRFLRNKSKTLIDLLKPETYIVLADVLRHEGLKSAVLFYDGLNWDAADTQTLENGFGKLAALAGLEYGRNSFGPGFAFVEFKLP